MRLKCIGGPMNGTIQNVYNYIKLYDHVDFPEYPKSVDLNFYRNIDEIVEASALPYYRYICDHTKYNDGNKIYEWTFLRYEKITIPEIFEKIFKTV